MRGLVRRIGAGQHYHARQIIGRLTPSCAATRCTGSAIIEESTTPARPACYC